MATLKPLADRIIVKQLPAEAKSAGGITIPDDAKEAPNRGTVKAVGTGTKEDPMVINVGEIALFGKYAGTEIEHEGENLLILKQNEVLAVLVEETSSETAQA